MIKGSCKFCYKEIQSYPSRIRKFCSSNCHDRYRVEINKKEKSCMICGKKWIPDNSRDPRYRRKTCSDDCARKAASDQMQGNIPHNYQGYKISTQGYCLVRIPGHPRSKDGYYKLANLVMEVKLGRLLTDGEVVHHIDLNKLNDSPENLMLFSSNSEHVRFHYENGHPLKGINNERKMSV